MINSDCIVVGAGLVGMFAALVMADQGMRVNVIDSKSPAELLEDIQGEVLLFPSCLEGNLTHLSEKSWDCCSKFVEKRVEDIVLEEVSELRLITSVTDLDRASVEHEELRQKGCHIEFLSQKDLRKFDSAFSPQVLSALLHRHRRAVDSERLYRSLWQACEEEKGISLRLGIEAFGIDVKDGRAVAVRSSDGPLKVGQILLASGVGMMGLISSTGVQLPVVPEQLYRLIGQPVGSERCCVISNYGAAGSASRKGSPERISTEMEACLFVVFGKKLRTSVGDGWEIGSVLHSSDHAALNELSRLFINFMPGYKNVFFDKVVSRFNALIADGLPIIGPVPNIGGLSLAMYHRDYKNILGPALGDWAAKWIVSGEAPEGATLLSMERFPQTAPGGRKALKD